MCNTAKELQRELVYVTNYIFNTITRLHYGYDHFVLRTSEVCQDVCYRLHFLQGFIECFPFLDVQFFRT